MSKVEQNLKCAWRRQHPHRLLRTRDLIVCILLNFHGILRDSHILITCSAEGYVVASQHSALFATRRARSVVSDCSADLRIASLHTVYAVKWRIHLPLKPQQKTANSSWVTGKTSHSQPTSLESRLSAFQHYSDSVLLPYNLSLCILPSL